MIATLRSTRVRPGWRPGLVAVATSAVTATLVVRWAVTAEWFVFRGALAATFVLGLGLVVGSTGMVGLASAPLLAAAVTGLDRPVGHAWGQALLVAILWYLATEAAWASIEARTDTARNPEIGRRRLEEVAAVVVLALVVGLAGTVLADLAPARTAVVKALAVAVTLIGLTALGRHLTVRAGPTPPTGPDATPPSGGPGATATDPTDDPAPTMRGTDR